MRGSVLMWLALGVVYATGQLPRSEFIFIYVLQLARTFESPVWLPPSPASGCRRIVQYSELDLAQHAGARKHTLDTSPRA